MVGGILNLVDLVWPNRNPVIMNFRGSGKEMIFLGGGGGGGC